MLSLNAAYNQTSALHLLSQTHTHQPSNPFNFATDLQQYFDSFVEPELPEPMMDLEAASRLSASFTHTVFSAQYTKFEHSGFQVTTDSAPPSVAISVHQQYYESNQRITYEDGTTLHLRTRVSSVSVEWYSEHKQQDGFTAMSYVKLERHGNIHIQTNSDALQDMILKMREQLLELIADYKEGYKYQSLSVQVLAFNYHDLLSLYEGHGDSAQLAREAYCPKEHDSVDASFSRLTQVLTVQERISGTAT